MAGAMMYRMLGRTGERVSAIGLGGWHLGLKHVDEPLTIRLVRSAIDRGITFMDNSLGLQRGPERAPDGQGAPGRLSRAGVPDDQDRRPVASGGRAAAGRIAAAPADRPHRPGPASRDPPLRGSPSHLRRGGRQRGAAGRARRRASCATSASPATRTRTSTSTCSTWRGSNGFRFDAVQMPLNVMDAHYRSFEQLVLPRARGARGSACSG